MTDSPRWPPSGPADSQARPAGGPALQQPFHEYSPANQDPYLGYLPPPQDPYQAHEPTSQQLYHDPGHDPGPAHQDPGQEYLPGPPQSYPGYGPAPDVAQFHPSPPVKSGRRPRFWIGLGVALVLFLCLGVGGAIGATGYFGYKVDKADAVAALREYLEDVNAGNFPAAYDQLCAEARAGVKREEYAQNFPAPRMVGFEIRGASMSSKGSESGYNVEAELRFEGGATRTETYFVFRPTDDLDLYHICP